MMFYERQPKENRENYKKMLSVMGRLSNLFSESDSPYLAYRVHENSFCRYLGADNLGRKDCSADARKDEVGIGLKTWVGNDDQKVAEFGRLKKTYTSLTGLDLVKKIAEYRNERIRVTKNMHGIEAMIYHVVKRVPGSMQIMECAFEPIDIENIKLLPKRGKDNNTYFTDGRHTYHFSVSKNTLYMIFDNLELLDTIEVDIMSDPYDFLIGLAEGSAGVAGTAFSEEHKEQLCLPLYSVKRGEKYVPEKSGLNQWNASGRKRDADELYIGYRAEDRERKPDFFPPRDTPFQLHLPDGTEISAKVCQEADKNNPLIGKAVMSNPNKVLGKWLLRDVFELPENTVVTYEMLEKFGVDSVVFTKLGELEYSVDFAKIGTYASFYGENEDNNEE